MPVQFLILGLDWNRKQIQGQALNLRNETARFDTIIILL